MTPSYRTNSRMTTSLKDRSVAIYDFGLFSSLAERLSRDFGRVGYFVPWETSFADGREYVLGMGLPGVHRIKNWDDEFEEFDLLVFPDVLCGDLQEYYRRQGHRVWGAGRGGELELLRWKTKQRLRDAGLPVNPCVKLVGTEALREHLQATPDQYVKVSTLRGLGETWHSPNYEVAKSYIDHFEAKHGAMQHIVEFIVEDSISDSNEFGFDGYCVDGQFPKTCLWGIEKKDEAYFGRVCPERELPESISTVNRALAPVMREMKYRQFFSTEIREKDKVGVGLPFVMDLTCRHASPPGELLCELCNNLSEILWFGAEGRMVEPQYTGLYGAQLLLGSDWAREHWYPVTCGDKLPSWLKLYNHACIKGTHYVVPQVDKMKEIGSVIAIADDADDAVQLCLDRAEKVDGFKLEYSPEALIHAQQNVEDLSPA